MAGSQRNTRPARHGLAPAAHSWWSARCSGRYNASQCSSAASASLTREDHFANSLLRTRDPQLANGRVERSNSNLFNHRQTSSRFAVRQLHIRQTPNRHARWLMHRRDGSGWTTELARAIAGLPCLVRRREVDGVLRLRPFARVTGRQAKDMRVAAATEAFAQAGQRLELR